MKALGREYDVFVGIFAESNPGEFSFAHVTECGSRVNEYVETILGRSTAPAAWETAVFRALQRVNRPECTVTICIYDRSLALGQRTTETARAIAVMLADRPNTAVTWIPKADNHPMMVRASALAREHAMRGAA